MSLQKILFYIILIISAVLAFYGYYNINLFWGEIAVVISILLWIFLRKKNPYICLILSITIAIIGIFFKIESILIFLYCGLSIILWDLSLMDKSLSKNSQDQKAITYQLMRLKILGLSLAISFPVIILSYFLNFKIPFFIMLLLIGLVFFCFDRLIKYSRK